MPEILWVKEFEATLVRNFNLKVHLYNGEQQLILLLLDLDCYRIMVGND